MTILELGTKFYKIFYFHPPLMHIMSMKSPTEAKIDIIKLDKEFSRRDPDYNGDECTYKDKKNVSLNMYVKEKYGNNAMEFIKRNI